MANPSSQHSRGRDARRAMTRASEQIAASLGEGIRTQDLLFTSSGTEANQMAIRSVLDRRLLGGEKCHWITTPIEHDSTLQLVSWVERLGGSVSFLPVTENGEIDFARLPELIRPETVLVSVIWVNNETGVVQDQAKASELLKARGIPLHLDGAQAWGKLPLSLPSTGASFVTFSGPKIGALGGTGLLWSAPGVVVEPLLLGSQQGGKRGGTENLFGIISLGAAASTLTPDAWSARVRRSRDLLEAEVLARLPQTRINGVKVSRVANTSNFTFQGPGSADLVIALDLAGYCVSVGSACASGAAEPSHVLTAMGLSREAALSSIRVSLSDELEASVISGFVETLAGVLERAQKSFPASGRSVVAQPHV